MLVKILFFIKLVKLLILKLTPSPQPHATVHPNPKLISRVANSLGQSAITFVTPG